MNLEEERKELAQTKQYDSREEFLHKTVKHIQKHQIKPELDFLEFGCASGRSAKLFVQALAPNKKYYTFDSFEGLPEKWHENAPIGRFRCNPPIFSDTRIKIVKGLFQDTVKDFVRKYARQVGFVNMDADLYSSTKYVLDNIRPLLGPGTLIAFDDFLPNDVGLNHEYKAWKEFREETGIQYRYIHSHRFTRVLVKIL